jgi:N utilization substance protein B
MLFQIDVTVVSPEEVFSQFWSEHPVDAETREFSESLVMGVFADRQVLDQWIGNSTAHWRIERMAVVDRNVLRMAVHELRQQPTPPAAVIIDEAIEVAKKFGSEESGAFINGILDAVRKRIESDSPGADPDESAG